MNRTSHNVKSGLKLCTMARTARKEALEAKLQQILKLKEEVKAEISADSESEGNVSAVSAPRATGLSDKCIVTFADGREIKVIIGTSEHIQEPLVDQICRIVDEAYSKVGKHKRVDRYDAVDRCLAFFNLFMSVCCLLCVFISIESIDHVLPTLAMRRLGLSWAGDQLYQSDPFSLLTYIPFPGTNFHELFRPRFLSQLCHPLGTRQVFGSV